MVTRMSNARPYIGGQAVLEGVMMKSPGGVSVAVRRPDKSIAIHEEPYTSRFGRGPWKLPGLRGVATLVESLGLGYRALNFSAEQQMSEEERESTTAAEGRATMIFSTVFAIGLFVALPQLLAAGSGRLFGIDFGLSDASYHLVIGGFKLAIVFAYLVLLRRVPELRRVFQYHGAEHKTIHAYEQNLELNVDNVRDQTTLHPRCGTTFLVVVVVVSILVGSVAAPLLLPDVEGILGQLLLLALRIALLPVIAAFSYEFQRFSAKHFTKGPLQVFLWPGFLFQKISTVEPSDDQIEVAIAAMKTAEWRDRNRDANTRAEPLHFVDFASFVAALPDLGASAAPLREAAE